MFFYLSKIFWWAVNPGNILFLSLAIGVVFLWGRQIRLARFFCTFALAVYFVCGVLPGGSYMLAELENRFQRTEIAPNEITGIIVLGGFLDVWLTDHRKDLALNGNVERATSLLDLTRKFPDVPVLFSGGAGLIGYPDLKEGTMLKGLLSDMVRGRNRLLIENESKNTYENALFSKKLIEENGGGKWLLVTSARHMPRAVGIFRQQGIDVLPYPVDYLGADASFNFSFFPSHTMNIFSAALHEWLGLFAYYVTGKTDELFPAP